MYSGSDVGDTDSDEGRRSIWIPGHVHHAGECLRDHVVAGLVRERALASEGRERGHDEPRIERLERIVVEAAFLHYVGAEVFDHNIHLGYERAEDLERFRLVEIEAQAFLAPVLLHEIAAASVFDR